MFYRSRSRHSPLVFAIVVALALAAAPAYACGIYLPREGEARVAQERALIRWDGQTEDLVMEMSVEGRSTEAAWIVPLPARATVKLADVELFDVLQEMTKPLIQVEVGAAPAEGAVESATTGSVSVLERQSLGPFEVSTLAARDASALETWLRTNGYRLPDALTPLLDDYVAKQWYYLAVRLMPDQVSEDLTGKLEPLWVSFPADELIYPMRLFALAPGILPVFLYVLADHRVALPTWADAAGDATVPVSISTPFAQWVEPQAIPEWSPLGPFIERKLFLTKFDIYFDNPAAIQSDFVFAMAANDAPYHEIEVQYVAPDDPRAPTAAQAGVTTTADRAGAGTSAADTTTATPSIVWRIVSLVLIVLVVVLALWFRQVGHRRLE